MLTYKNIRIIGTSHIANASIRDIEVAFKTENPDIVAVELDRGRLQGLLSGEKPSYSIKLVKRLGLKGYLFAVVGAFIQQKLGNIVGVRPGSDMLRAVELARDNQKRIALIDQDVQITLAKLSKSITWKDRLHFVADIFKAPFSKRMQIDLNKVPPKNLIHELMGILKKRYPGVYAVLVEERNRIMALRIKTISEAHFDKKILVVVGAGHEEELLDLIKKDIIRTSQSTS